MRVWKILAGSGVDFYLPYGISCMVEPLFKPSMYGADPGGVIIDREIKKCNFFILPLHVLLNTLLLIHLNTPCLS